MEPSLHIATYWPRVIIRAAGSTVQFFGGKKLVVPPTLFTIGALIHVYRAGSDAIWQEVDLAISFGLGAFATFFAALFVWNLVLTPARIEREQNEIHQTALKSLRLTISKLEKDIFDNDKRQQAISRLWDVRAEGVNLRNRLISIGEYDSWYKEYGQWESMALSEANKISQSFEKWLRTLDRVRRPPNFRNPSCCEEHQKNRADISEMLFRIQAFLEADMLKHDLQHRDLSGE